MSDTKADIDTSNNDEHRKAIEIEQYIKSRLDIFYGVNGIGDHNHPAYLKYLRLLEEQTLSKKIKAFFIFLITLVFFTYLQTRD